MAQANDSLRLLPDGTGTDIATHLINSKEYQVVMQAGMSGHIFGSLETFMLFIPPQAVGASKLHFDLFNGSGSNIVKVRGFWVTADPATANTSGVAVRIDWFRTSAVGTGGTAATYNNTTTTNPGFIGKDSNNTSPITNSITARAAPTGGATSASFWFMSYHQTEELQATSTIQNMFNLLPDPDRGEQEMALQPSQGMKAVQGTVAGAGSVGFLVSFTVE